MSKEKCIGRALLGPALPEGQICKVSMIASGSFKGSISFGVTTNESVSWGHVGSSSEEIGAAITLGKLDYNKDTKSKSS